MEAHLAAIQRAYYSVVFNGTKVILSPVMDAVSETLTNTVTNSVRKGISDALVEGPSIWDVVFGKKK